MQTTPFSPVTQRIHIAVRGAVQGVGFRPFVHRLATELRLAGWVLNSPRGVFIEVEGPAGALDAFLVRLQREQPPRAAIHSVEAWHLDPAGYAAFDIRPSTEEGGGETGAIVMPDIATCPDCLRELRDPADRRHRYPFINCTNCGPRFSIIESLPYDRPRTTMRGFAMCPACSREYHDPADRRFHAQPIACPACGPRLQLWNSGGAPLADRDDALRKAAAALRDGLIVATKGLGGFHLMADARNDRAVARLRLRKHREEKPFALMAPSLAWVASACELSPLEERLLASPEAPIVLLRRTPAADVCAEVAPRNPYLGVMLPSNPLQHLLAEELGFPVVATSGNLSDEPICTDEHEALRRLGGIAELFLVHDRPVRRHVDDSIARVVLGRELITRRARGYAPLPVLFPGPTAEAIAVGAHLKNTIAVARGDAAFVSQHIGDLETAESLGAFRRELDAFRELYRVRPRRVVSDLHPDYLSTRHAREMGLPHVQVQHHYAHVASCMAENRLAGRVLGVSWDGTGYGTDGTVWGGEFLLTDERGFRRVAALRPFRLPGGEAAVREPRRAALGLLAELFGEEAAAMTDLAPVAAWTAPELALLLQMLRRGVNSPVTTSAGRLFDAAAALCGLRQRCSFEGQAAMELEFAVGPLPAQGPYPVGILPPGDTRGTGPDGADVVDWGPLMRALIADVRGGMPPSTVASRFHAALTRAIVSVARRVGERRVVLTGGCFQNRVLTEETVGALRGEGFSPYWHQRVPPNDGGIALGQLYAAHRAAAGEAAAPPGPQQQKGD